MKLHSLQLTNFRCFESLTIEFDKKLTVLVANNGMGKTAVLEALAIGLGSFLSNLPGVSGRNPKETDFRLADDGKKPPYMRIRTETTDGIVWDRTERRDKAKSTLKSIPDSIGHKTIAQYALSLYPFNESGRLLPCIAYYGTGRAVFDTPSNRRIFKRNTSLVNAFGNALDAKPNFRRFFEYFYFLEDIERREKEQRRDWDHRLFELKIIREAISRLMPSFSRPHSEIRPLRFMIDWLHENTIQTLRIEQLSDGYRTTLATAMDIASRLSALAELNGIKSVNEALSTEGIALIDEIDLHLHPSWQQRILPDLMRTFPNIQFIVTTHSPQVISTVPSHCIRVIDDGQVYSAPAGTEGAEASRVLKRVFGVDVRPPENAATKELKEYLALVDAEKWDSPRAKELRQKLDARYQGEEPALLEADLHIENRLWELGQ